MKPKLIILNGPLGIGKSTIAKAYAQKHPLTLNLDIDKVWSTISHWREEKDTSASIAQRMAIEMARINLIEKNDVIIPQIIQDDMLRERFQSLAKECEADFFEFLLLVDKTEAIKRYKVRGRASGYVSGFRPGGIIDSGGREKKLSEMYDNMLKSSDSSPQIIRIESIDGDIEGTLDQLIVKMN